VSICYKTTFRGKVEDCCHTKGRYPDIGFRHTLSSTPARQTTIYHPLAMMLSSSIDADVVAGAVTNSNSNGGGGATALSARILNVNWPMDTDALNRWVMSLQHCDFSKNQQCPSTISSSSSNSCSHQVAVAADSKQAAVGGAAADSDSKQVAAGVVVAAADSGSNQAAGDSKHAAAAAPRMPQVQQDAIMNAITNHQNNESLFLSE